MPRILMMQNVLRQDIHIFEKLLFLLLKSLISEHIMSLALSPSLYILSTTWIRIDYQV